MALVKDDCPSSRGAAAVRLAPIRSTATLAGNIANGSPIGDTMPLP